MLFPTSSRNWVSIPAHMSVEVALADFNVGTGKMEALKLDVTSKKLPLSDVFNDLKGTAMNASRVVLSSSRDGIDAFILTRSSSNVLGITTS